MRRGPRDAPRRGMQYAFARDGDLFVPGEPVRAGRRVARPGVVGLAHQAARGEGPGPLVPRFASPLLPPAPQEAVAQPREVIFLVPPLVPRLPLHPRG